MVAFNASILQQWKSQGYRFILVLPRDKYGVLRPLRDDKSVSKGYTIDISEISLIQMAEDYFLTKEKDAEIPVLQSRAPRS
jgi:hypothetical protein